MSIADISEAISTGKDIDGSDFLEFMILCSACVAETMERIYSTDLSWKHDTLQKLCILFHGDENYERCLGGVAKAVKESESDSDAKGDK